jgi:hypothetical protein
MWIVNGQVGGPQGGREEGRGEVNVELRTWPTLAESAFRNNISAFMKFAYSQELVLQLPASSIQDYDAMIELEDRIIAGLGNLGKVSGHDMGVGEMNIFIRTDHPKLTFESLKELFGTRDFMPELKAAYRDVGKDNFTVIYPADLDRFAIA